MPAVEGQLKSSWISIALVNFAIAAIMGLLLRLAFVIELDWLSFRSMMHAHSHVALLGWLYLVFYALIWYKFIPIHLRKHTKYVRLFWFTQLNVVGMMISFPIQGYGLFSIIFSTLHLFSSYVFAYLVWKEAALSKSKSGLMLRTAIIWMVISTLGVWELGPVMALGLKNTVMYFTAIQFFLHFQFNGWFTFGALAILFKLLSEKNIEVDQKRFQIFYWLLVVSCILTFALAVTWSSPNEYLFFLNGTGVIIQLGALFIGVLSLKPSYQLIKANLSGTVKTFYGLALISFILKILTQAFVVIPQIAVISYTIRQFVVGFVHLTMLGSISCFIIGVLIEENQINASKKSNLYALWAFVLGFVLMELILFIQGMMLWIKIGFMPFYYETILLISILLPAALLVIVYLKYVSDKSHKII